MKLCLYLGTLCIEHSIIAANRRLALARPNSERRARERRPNFG